MGSITVPQSLPHGGLMHRIVSLDAMKLMVVLG
jgi:hypothetical protein